MTEKDLGQIIPDILATATVDNKVGEPAVNVTVEQINEVNRLERKFNFEFVNMKGEKGDTPVKGVDYLTEEEKQQFTTETLSLVTAEGTKQVKTVTDKGTEEVSKVTAEGNKQISLTQAEALKVIEQLKKLVEGNPETSNAQTLSGKTRVEFEQDLIEVEKSEIEPVSKSVFGERKLLIANPVDTDWTGIMDESGNIIQKEDGTRWHKTYKLCDKDTTIKVYDWAGGNVKHCVFLNSSKKVLGTTTGGWVNKYIDVQVPAGSKYVVVNATDNVEKVSCKTYTHDTSFNVNKKINDIDASVESINSSLKTINNKIDVIHSLSETFDVTMKSVTDTLFTKKYTSLSFVDETNSFLLDGKLANGGKSRSYIINKYINKTVKAKGFYGGNCPLAVFFDINNEFICYVNGDREWVNDYQEITVPYNAYKVYISDNDAKYEIDLQVPEFESFDLKKELETIKTEIQNIIYELQNAQSQLAKTQRFNDFDYANFDKAYFVLTIDDANKYLSEVYDLCHELGIVMCPAIIPSELNTIYDNSNGRSIKDICDLVVADGGEILSHSGKYIKDDSTYTDYEEVFRDTKKILEDNGYEIRGIITAGGAGYSSFTKKLDDWSRKYYDYSDQNGLKTSPAYSHSRWWHHDYSTIENCKTYVDNAIKNKSFVVMAMHGTDDTSDLEHITHLRELLEYMISKGKDKLQFVTWAYVYDNFGTTKLEKRIKALESK